MARQEATGGQPDRTQTSCSVTTLPPIAGAADGNFTLAEFCAWARLGKTATYSEIAKGRLIAIKCLSRTLIRREDAEAWRDALPRINPKTNNPSGGA